MTRAKLTAILTLLILILTPIIVKAEELDPCWDGNCSYVVDASTNTTTIVRLSDAEIEARKNIPAPVPTPTPTEPIYDLVVVTEKQSFGTSGVVQDLQNVVQDLESRAKTANDNKYIEPCLYQTCVKIIADGLKQTEVEITYKDLRDRAEQRLLVSEQLNELALKARQVLSEIEVMSRQYLPLIEEANV